MFLAAISRRRIGRFKFKGESAAAIVGRMSSQYLKASRFATLNRGPVGLTIGVSAGNSLSFVCETVIEPENETGVPADLTGYEFNAFVSRQSDAVPLVPFLVEPVDLAEGKFRLSLTAEQTATLTPGTYRWRLVWTPPGGEPYTAIQHPFEVFRT